MVSHAYFFSFYDDCGFAGVKFSTVNDNAAKRCYGSVGGEAASPDTAAIRCRATTAATARRKQK
jgi:hypothetical protein